MRFLVDAQLPRRLAHLLREAGQDVTHTLDLPGGNATPDAVLIKIARAEQRVLITKDADFVSSFILSREPEKLLLISTGNISNAALEALLLPRFSSIVAALQINDFVEVNRQAILVHV